MTQLKQPSKISWNEIDAVGLPPADLRQVGQNMLPRTFLCRGEWSIFTSCMFADGSGWHAEDGDTVRARAVIDGF